MKPADVAKAIEADLRGLQGAYTPALRDLRKGWTAKLKPEQAGEVIEIALGLAASRPQETKWIAYELVRHHRGAYDQISQAQLEAFASELASWYAVDAFGTILLGPLWAKGRVGDELIDRWAASPSRWLRRAALVATVGLNARGHGPDGDAARTLKICRALAADRDDMVEKALSWALRFLSQRDRPAVAAFMEDQGENLPARVRREVRTKLTTGKKNARASER
jgi:3-methyladenine DNA glycosylase AlkD